ncbi:MAG TPA: J domain-containing protein [Candidatus Limnocylindrales bacterium]|nr:J domain-containing protein [Candidatus Limnocylindrales bacterium]
MEFQDYYKTLGVPRTASQAEIKKAFRKLARESHPDKHPGDKAAERRFKDVNEANAVLSDPSKREKFDRFGKDWEAYERAGAAAGGAAGSAGGNPFGPNGPFAGYAGGSRTGAGGVRYEFRTSADAGDFSDFFRMMFGDEGAAAGEPERFSTRGSSMDDILAGMGYAGAARGGSRASADRVGQARLAPVEATAEITLEEAFQGTTRIVEVGGRRLEVTIPRGVDSGNRIRLSGKGPDGRDLVVVTQVRPHRTFTRTGADLEREVPITLKEALLGGEIHIGTLKGRVLLKLSEGTQNGRKFRLKGQGMPRLRVEGAGDLYVRVKVIGPSHLSDDARAAAQRFFELVDQPDPRA